MSAERDLDVVVPTRDRPDRLAVCLDALSRQTDDRFGVIVVDDGGRVPAAEVAVAPTGPGVRFVRNETSIGAGASRNRGAAASEARFLVFLDDDCRPAADLVARHRTALSAGDGGPVVALGPIRALPERRLPVWTHWDADRLECQYERLALGAVAPHWTHLYTGNVGLRRADFVAVGGFDPRFSRQEDVELGYRLHRMGARFTFDPAAVVHHDSDRSLRTWLCVPAASARFDVLMDSLVPGSGRLAAIREGLASRHWALRLARRALRAEPARRAAVIGAIGAGRLLHALRADRVSLAAFSLVWDLTYHRALQDAMSADPATDR